jgi:hypothetical protein
MRLWPGESPDRPDLRPWSLQASGDAVASEGGAGAADEGAPLSVAVALGRVLNRKAS